MNVSAIQHQKVHVQYSVLYCPPTRGQQMYDIITGVDYKTTQNNLTSLFFTTSELNKLEKDNVTGFVLLDKFFFSGFPLTFAFFEGLYSFTSSIL